MGYIIDMNMIKADAIITDTTAKKSAYKKQFRLDVSKLCHKYWIIAV